MLGQLTHNGDTGRLNFNGTGLHAGDPLEVLITDSDGRTEWIATRIEYSTESKAWYLVGLSGYQANGMIARIRE